MERSSTQQTHIDAPVEVVWDLLGDPNRHPEWWPEMIEVECADLEQGCRYRGVVKGPFGRQDEHEILIEELENCRQVSIHCEGTGVYNRFYLTEARGGTFVEGCFGAIPHSVGMKVFGAVAGRRFLRSWLSRSLERLKTAAERVPAA
jgi:carbon monoxide dehydrogenase subunit G